MNYRQWKKKYKKVHGHNPYTKKESNAFSDVIKLATEDILKNVNKMFCAVKNAIYDIQNMPEEEFREKLKKLTTEQKTLAYQIRGMAIRKVGDYTFS